MHNLSSRPLPAAHALPYVHFSLAMDGAILFAVGPGLGRVGLDDDALRGVSVYDLYAENPDLGPVYAQLFQGRRVQTELRFAGVRWYFDGHPVMQGGVQIGVSGMATVLEEEHAEPGPYQVWAAAGDNARHSVWSGDGFHVPGDPDAPVTLVRRLPRRLFNELYDEDPTRLHLLRDSRPARPRLRLL